MSWAMAEVYGAVTDRIMVNLARYFPYIKDADEVQGSFAYQARMLAQLGQVNRETADIIAQSLDGADAALRQTLEAAIMDALSKEEPKLRKAAEKGLLQGGGLLPPEVTPNQLQAFSTYYAQSADRLNLVNTVMLESTQAAYTATVTDAAARIGRTQSILNVGAGEVVTGVSAWNMAMHDAVQKMVKNGLTGFVDHAGRKWSPEAYVAMDIRTTMFNTARAAVWERAEGYGADMYQVSSHNGARPLCYPWQGKVISRSDWSGDVEDLDGNKVHVYAQSETSYGEAAGLFGVNCRHYPMTFIPGFSVIRGEPQDPEENAEAYALSQEQRGLERKLREEKRDLAVMQAQGAGEDEIRAQRERVNRASAQIEDFCDEHDLPRRRSRESAPVRATWPQEGCYDPTQFPTETRDRMGEFFGEQVAEPEERARLQAHNSNVVAEDGLNTPAFQSKFNSITPNAEVNGAVRESAIEMLRHRSGSDEEDLYLIDGNSGQILSKLTSSDKKLGVQYDEETLRAIDQAHKYGTPIIAIHNHPNGLPPTLDDGSSALAHGYAMGIAVGHNQEVWVYSKTKAVIPTSVCNLLHNALAQKLKNEAEVDFEEQMWYDFLSSSGMEVKRL